MAGVTLDSGVLIAADRNDRRAWALKAAAVEDRSEVRVPATVLAQAWRGPTSANLARFLRGCRIVDVDEAMAKAAGELCGQSGLADIVDASVVAVAEAASGRRGRGVVVTTDVEDIRTIGAGRVEIRGFPE